MPLSECCANIDCQGRELIDHGDSGFPVACYQDNFQIMDVPWHWHPEWEAVYIVDGSCTVAAGHQKQIFQAGDGFFVNSGVLHGCWDLENSECIFHSIVFHPRIVSGSLDSAMHLNYVLPLMETGPELFPLSADTVWQREALDSIEQAWQAFVQAQTGYEFSVRAALSRLILFLWQHTSSAGFLQDRKAIRDGARIKSMLAHIHENYANDLSLSRIAAVAAVSESECLRCFRNAIGITPIQYLKQYRIQQAANLMISTEKKFSDIAQQCGFQDISYFTKSFRDQMGCTPTEYRKAKRRS